MIAVSLFKSCWSVQPLTHLVIALLHMLGSFCVHTLLSSLSLSFSQEYPMICQSWSLHNITDFLLVPQWSIQGAKCSLLVNPRLALKLPQCAMNDTSINRPTREELPQNWQTFFCLENSEYLLLPDIISIFISISDLMLREQQNSSGFYHVHENSGLFIWNASDSSGKPQII